MAISRATKLAFFDSNVLLFLLSPDPHKADIAEHLVSLGGTISVQVLNEFTQVARRKLKMSPSDVVTVLSTLRRALKVESLTDATHDLGVELSVKYSSRVYEAIIVTSGLSCGATKLYSEDMRSGLLVEKQLRIDNSFAPAFKMPCSRAQRSYWWSVASASCALVSAKSAFVSVNFFSAVLRRVTSSASALFTSSKFSATASRLL